ncbi:DUF421 domain-containing protein [Stakelama saccharophila]|uniref:DUF421 domain-containing protein n=1 Tax=Stakelama saccharophila TaxID=3075605 RepID=A0ABZ0BC14_9SPHN|nr:YetF domain-containing protein [Stakelama sp. W311]WNO54837.1 DUF421 domain-containing protein [Stakelama sp. W311]
MFGLDPIPEAVVRGALLSLIGLVWIVTLVRIAGLRTLSKMTAIDFVATLATGSLLATMVSSSSWPGFVQALIGVAMLTGWQYCYAKARRNDAVRNFSENRPMLLLRNGKYLEDAMAEARVTRADILSKLREHNIAGPDRVDAVILEVTGDISILSGGHSSPAVLDDVRRA